MNQNYSEPNFKHGNRKITKAMANQMAKMRSKGKSWSEIANKYGVAVNTVRYNVDNEYRQTELERSRVNTILYK